jgi:hypothetical protein
MNPHEPLMSKQKLRAETEAVCAQARAAAKFGEKNIFIFCFLSFLVVMLPCHS